MAIPVAVFTLGSSDSGSNSSSGSGNGSAGQSAAKPPPGVPLGSDLAPVPTNHVTGVGDAEVHLDGTLATVTVHTTGLLDPAAHAMHIHAGDARHLPARHGREAARRPPRDQHEGRHPVVRAARHGAHHAR